MICTRTLVAQKHHACKSENKYCGLFVVSLTCTFPPTSKYFDSQGMAASRAAHLPHILRASRQVTAAARQNAACRRVFCALHPPVLLHRCLRLLLPLHNGYISVTCGMLWHGLFHNHAWQDVLTEGQGTVACSLC